MYECAHTLTQLLHPYSVLLNSSALPALDKNNCLIPQPPPPCGGGCQHEFLFEGISPYIVNATEVKPINSFMFAAHVKVTDLEAFPI